MTARHGITWTLLLLAATFDAGCRGPRSILAPVTPEAGGIALTWWLFLAVCAAVYVIVIGALGFALSKQRNTRATLTGATQDDPQRERSVHRIIAIAAGLTATILVGLLLTDLWIQRGIKPRDGDVLAIKLVGRQWWWSAEYQSPNPSEVFETANEIHVPVGRPIRLLISADDVIHSFWIPRLHGKRDLVPGHPSQISFQIDQPGRYPGLCAEFCGFQHAHMGLFVVAEEPEKFEAWAHSQRGEAAAPACDEEQRGQDLFERSTCAMCHTVRGIEARSRLGPDLTHLATRTTIGAGVATNTREQLAAWIANPQAMKPGVRMPESPLPPADQAAIVTYLESLK